MAGPASSAAAMPVSTKMPAPIIPPTPKKIKSKALKQRFSSVSFPLGIATALV